MNWSKVHTNFVKIYTKNIISENYGLMVKEALSHQGARKVDSFFLTRLISTVCRDECIIPYQRLYKISDYNQQCFRAITPLTLKTMLSYHHEWVDAICLWLMGQSDNECRR